VRVPGGLLITPSGLPKDELCPSDIVALDAAGKARGRLAPSSEWHFHLDILNTRPEANAVLHMHSMFATTLACLHRGIPAFHYMVAVAGGDDIRCARYATFGTEALSRHARAALKGRKACLLANHGMIVLGASLKDALQLAVEVETLASQYWRALQIGKPVLLSKAEMARVLKKFESYGKPRTV
jgi:L-fuculose-phosphate aldolase